MQPKRGTIYDSNMTELAVSASTERVEIYPSQFVSKDNVNSLEKGLNIPVEQQQERVARLLSDVLGIEYETVLKKAQDTKKGGLSIAFGVEKRLLTACVKKSKKPKTRMMRIQSGFAPMMGREVIRTKPLSMAVSLDLSMTITGITRWALLPLRQSAL